MSDENNIKKISHYLEIGGTMLAEHCGVCGAPMFRYQGNIICPLCVEDEKEQAVTKQKARYPPTVRSDFKPDIRDKKELEFIERRDLKSQNKKHLENVLKSKSDNKYSDEGEQRTYRAHMTYPEEEELRALILMKLIKIAEENLNELDPRRVDEWFKLTDKGINLVRKIDGYDYEDDY